MLQNNRVFGAILLITGTCIGAGMLALPVSTAQYGLLPSALLFVSCWLTMTFAALLILEVNLWLPHDSNMISMAHAKLDVHLFKDSHVRLQNSTISEVD